jgi:acetyl esterase/lipase
VSDVRGSTDIEFAVADGPRPDADAPVPVVLHLHGGAWRADDKAVDAEDRLAELARHGIAVAPANHRFVYATYPARI